MYEERVKFIEYKGKRILSLDYSGCKLEQLPDIFKIVLEVVSKEAPNSCIYLTNVENFSFSLKALSTFNKFAEETKPYDKGGAILGATGLVRVMYDGFSKVFTKTIKAFDTREEALEWLNKTF